MATETTFSANFQRYSHELTSSLVRIERALATISDANILPPAADQLRASARVGTVHYSNLIEGNELPIVEAERAADHELQPDTRAKVELINYVDALDLLDLRYEQDGLEPTPGLLKAIQGAVTRGLGSEDSDHFKPHHEGQWRDGRALVVDHTTNTIMHEGPPAKEVPSRMAGMCSWVANKEGRLDEFPAPVIAGVGHYAITDIHPFADGNGRVARLFTAALLMRHGYLPGRLFSFERYYAEDRTAYYEALRSVRRNTYNMEEWLGYFLEGLAEEYERVRERVLELNRLGLTDRDQLQLSSTQEKALSALALEGRREFTRAEYETAAGGISRSEANREIIELEGRVVDRVGQGPSTRYRFRNVQPLKGSGTQPGRKRSWTDQRIEQELRTFCGDREDWPSAQEFRDAGQAALYQAVVRHGGPNMWAERLGLRPRRRGQSSQGVN